MNKRMFETLGGRVQVGTALFMALLLGGFYPGAVSRVNAQTPKEEAASSQGGGQMEGIKVHGHWTIDVRNPDGKLVTHREFENHLTGGGSVLSAALARRRTVGEWHVELDSGFDHLNDPCSLGTTPTPCAMGEVNGSAPDGSGISKTLVLSTPLIQGSLFSFVLSGNVTAQKAGNVKRVMTAVWNCPSNVLAESCKQNTEGSQYIEFTSTTLPQPINVAASQIVQVTVTITFS